MSINRRRRQQRPRITKTVNTIKFTSDKVEKSLADVPTSFYQNHKTKNKSGAFGVADVRMILEAWAEHNAQPDQA